MLPFQPKSRDGKDWFRQVRWGEAEQTLFRAKLAKARAWGRPQYLRIQAVTLQRKLPRVALALFDECIALDTEGLQTTWAHDGRAEVLLRLGDLAASLEAYEKALANLFLHPGMIPSALLDYPFLIATRGVRHRYDRALELLDVHGQHPTFPINRFKAAAARALIAEARNDNERAVEFAKIALSAAAETRSEFRFHSDLGLVGGNQIFLINRLLMIARGVSPNHQNWIRVLISGLLRR